MRLDQRMEWDDVCTHILTHIKKNVQPKVNERGFRNWFAKREKFGIMFDYKTIYRCWVIHNSISRDNQDHMILICGTTGLGKSHLAGQILCWLLPDAELDAFVYNAAQFLTRLELISVDWTPETPSRGICFDEAARELFSREAMKSGNRELNKVFFEMRMLRCITILCAPSFHHLDKAFRLERVGTFIQMLPNHKFKGFVRSVIPRLVITGGKLSTLNLSLPIGTFWYGHSNANFPEQLSWNKYNVNKLVNLQKNIKRSKAAVGGEKYYSTGQAAKLLGLSETGVRTMCDDGRLECIKIGKVRRIKASCVNSILEGQNA